MYNASIISGFLEEIMACLSFGCDINQRDQFISPTALKVKDYSNNVQAFSFDIATNTVRLHSKTNWLMLFRKTAVSVW
jgi:hypothetical protein